MRIDRVLNRSVGIIGLARSGLAAAKLVKRLGGRPFVSDAQVEQALGDRVAQLKAEGIPYETGGHTDKLLQYSEFLIVSPGVPPDVPILLQAERKGIPVFSELEVAFWLCDARLAAITGSNGKTTTTALLGAIYKNAGFESAAAGNIGFPFSDVSDSIPATGWIALEVSSFQLERIFEFRPNLAIILNLSPDHLDRYGTFEAYAAMKLRVAENMTSAEKLILNADDATLISLAAESQAAKVYFSRRHERLPGVYLEGGKIAYKVEGQAGHLGAVDEIRIPGPHNLYNAMAAGLAAVLSGVPDEIIRHTFRTFPGVEHRLEFVAEVGGVRYVNDSKGTNVDSVWYALQSVPQRMVLIMGGKWKGGDLSILADLIRERVKHIILIGQAKDLMAAAFKDSVPTSFAKTLEEAVAAAADLAQSGETVLLSPACASFDMFTDFEHRGRVFKAAVRSLQARGHADD